MRTSLDLCFCLLTLCGITSVLCGVKVVVKQDDDAVLPCLISTEDISGKLFDWKKDRKEVFFYDSGLHYNNGFPGQDEQFRGRVSHFQDQLKNGNASIKISNTKMADSGNYRCIFPRLQPSQTFNIELVVAASPKPYVTRLDETHDRSLLQCEVQGASPEPKVEWKDSSGNILPAERPQVSERGSSYSITLNITVTQTGRYRCVVTQEEINHQTYSETFVFINENLSREVKHWRSAAILAAVLAAVLPLVVAVVWCRCRSCRLRSKHLSNQIMKSSTTPHDMKQDHDCRASEDRADTELTERSFHEWIMLSSDDPQIRCFREPIMISCDYPQIRSTTPHDMKQDHDCRASEDRADTELTQRITCNPHEWT